METVETYTSNGSTAYKRCFATVTEAYREYRNCIRAAKDLPIGHSVTVSIYSNGYMMAMDTVYGKRR